MERHRFGAGVAVLLLISSGLSVPLYTLGSSNAVTAFSHDWMFKDAPPDIAFFAKSSSSASSFEIGVADGNAPALRTISSSGISTAAVAQGVTTSQVQGYSGQLPPGAVIMKMGGLPEIGDSVGMGGISVQATVAGASGMIVTSNSQVLQAFSGSGVQGLPPGPLPFRTGAVAVNELVSLSPSYAGLSAVTAAVPRL